MTTMTTRCYQVVLQACCVHGRGRARARGGRARAGVVVRRARAFLGVGRREHTAHLPDGRKLLSSSRQPLLDTARVLLAEGVPPETSNAMQHKGSATIAMTSTVGEAAKLTVEEESDGPRFRKWRPFPAGWSARAGDESDAGAVATRDSQASPLRTPADPEPAR